MAVAVATPSLLHRLAAFSLLVLVLVAGYMLIERVWLGKYAFYKDNIEQLQDRLQRFGNMLATRSELEAQLQQIRQDSAVDAYYLPQTSATLAASELQQQVRTAVEGNGGNLVSTQVLPATEEEAFTRVAIRVQMAGDTATLQRVFHQLESGQPLLFIDDVQIRSQPLRQRDPNDRNQVKIQIQLNIQFELSGYMHRSGA